MMRIRYGYFSELFQVCKLSMRNTIHFGHDILQIILNAVIFKICITMFQHDLLRIKVPTHNL